MYTSRKSKVDISDGAKQVVLFSLPYSSSLKKELQKEKLKKKNGHYEAKEDKRYIVWTIQSKFASFLSSTKLLPAQQENYYLVSRSSCLEEVAKLVEDAKSGKIYGADKEFFQKYTHKLNIEERYMY